MLQVIAPTPPISYAAYCQEIAKGLPVHLGYLAKNAACREGFDALMPGVRSIVCCAVPLPEFPEGMALKYARFCAIGDYHAVLRTKLEGVEGALRGGFPRMRSRICVDSAPILERELAVRAGFGSIGFNRMLVHPIFGSYVVLGELLTDVDAADLGQARGYLDAANVSEMACDAHARQNAACAGEALRLPSIGDATLRARCTPGACQCCPPGARKCVQACPSQALTDAGYDVHKCHAYWTTQHKGEIPEPFASRLGDQVWGCDLCQKACPRNARVPQAPVVSPAHPLCRLSIPSILTLSARKLRAALAGTPLFDAHPYMLVRNTCLVLRNTHNTQYADLVRAVAQGHACDWVRRAAEACL